MSNNDEIIGTRFGHLTVIELDHISLKGTPYWLCECDCGNREVVSEKRLSSNAVKSCGCQPRGRVMVDLTGRRFGRLVVLGFDHKDVRNQSYWLCECDCGNQKVVSGASLRHELTTSCGCRKHERRTEDLTGKRFGRLRVLGFSHMAHKGNSYWLCECDCGNTSIVTRSTLLDGRTRSCGCGSREGMTPIDLTGQRFGHLYILCLDHKNSKSGAYWLCECDCGNTILYRTGELVDGRATSCGCTKNNPKSTHNVPYDSLYNIGCGIRQRCENDRSPAFKHYGGRGIYVCDEWHNFEDFRDWAFETGYESGLTIDRINNDDGYYPENCRWADAITQNNNRRSNHYVTYNGLKHSVAEWSRLLGVGYSKLLRRVVAGDMRDFEEYFGTEE